MTETKKIGYRDVFRQKEYMKMIIASLINRFGDSIDAIAYTWIVYELTGNAAWSAVIFGANKVPSVLITPLAGAWVEGRRKKTIMVVTDLIRAVCVAFVATGYLLGFLQAWMLLATTLIISTAEAFRGPANTALTPKVLSRECYEYGMSLSSTLASVVELIGMAVAAGIIAAVGTAGAIYIDMATFVLSAFIILFVNSREENLQKQSFNGKEYASSLKEGFQYVTKSHAIRYLILVCLFLNMMLVPFNSLQAPLASEVLHGGAEVLSVLGIMATVGMLLGSLTYPMLREKVHGSAILFIGGAGLSLFYLGVTAFEPFYENKWFMYGWVALISLIFGYGVSVANALVNVEVVKRTEENHLARVGGIFSALGSAATPVTSFFVSALVAYVSTKALFIAVGLLNVVGAVTFLKSRALEENGTSNRVEVYLK